MNNILAFIRKSKNLHTVINGVVIASLLYTPLSGFSSNSPSNRTIISLPSFLNKSNALDENVFKIEEDTIFSAQNRAQLNVVEQKTVPVSRNNVDIGRETTEIHQPIFSILEIDIPLTVESVIGNEANKLDDPSDNIFNFNVNQEDLGIHSYAITFEVLGLKNIASIPISINANKSIGGSIIQKSNEWQTMTYVINPRDLQQGINHINFYAPNSEVSYRIKNITLSQVEVENINKLHLFSCSYYQASQATLSLTGFFDTSKFDLYLNDIKQHLSQDNFDIIYHLTESEIKSGQVKIDLKDSTGEIAESLFKPLILMPDVVENNKSEVLNSSVLAFPNALSHVTLDDASITITPQSLDVPTTITIAKLGSRDIMPLPSGIKNITKDRGAYRFLPDGLKFNNPVEIQIPFDSLLLPKNFDKSKLVTMYFDIHKRKWESIKIDSIDMQKKCIIAKTDHFTDYINGVIQVPESPETSAFVPTMMSDIKAADPTAEMILMQPPTASQTGEASMSYPIKIPAGRNGMQPSVAVHYNSEAGTGWLGEGWNIAKQGISIDTRWGIPTFNPDSETEVYTLAGEQLMYPKNPGSEYEYMPHRHEGELGQSNLTTALQARNQSGAKVFTFRKQEGFSKIERLGTSPSTYYWKVTNSSGIVQWYGGDETGLKSTHILQQLGGNIFHWALVKTVDLHGNTITYSYDKGIYNSGASNLNGGTYFYLSNINYTGYNGALGNYDVTFNKQNTVKHNPSIYAKNGLKEVDPFLLDNIQVKYDQEIIRSYKFQYTTGQFEKILLKRLIEYDGNNNEFHRHEFDYHDDFSTNNGNLFYESKRVLYPAFSPDYTLNFGNIINASKLGSMQSIDYGFNIRPAFGFEFRIPFHSNRSNRTFTFGAPHHWNFSNARGRVALVDMDGDGLDDIVYRTASGIKYIPNKIANPNNGNSEFSNDQLINFYYESPTENVQFISDFSKSKGQNYTPILQALSFEFRDYFTGFKNIKSFNEANIYLVDANADGFMDIVRDGIVYFNYKDALGQTKFAPSSSLSENLLITAEQPVIEPIPEEDSDNTLIFNYDAVKVWTAPTVARIEIKDHLELINPTADAYALYTVELLKKDGNGGYYPPCRLYLAELDFSNPVHSYAISNTISMPLGCNQGYISVNAGDMVLFRLHKKEGDNFEVLNDPMINFMGLQNDIYDANNNKINETSYQESFTLSGVETFTSQGNGNVNIYWDNIALHNLSSNIQFIIRKLPLESQDEGEIIFQKNYVANTPNDILSVNNNSVSVNLSNVPVALDDDIYVEINSDSNINWEMLNWFPKLIYTTNNEDFQTGNINANKVLVPSKTIHKLESFEGNLPLGQLYCSTTTPVTIAVKPNTTLLSGSNNQLTVEDNGFFRLVIKSNQQLIKTYDIIVEEGVVSLPDNNPVTIFNGILDSNAPEVYFDFYANGKLNFELLNKYLSSIDKRYLVYLNGTLSNNLSELNCHMGHLFNAVNIYSNYYFLFGGNYNNWGQFFYNPYADDDSNTPYDQYGKLINPSYLNMGSYSFEFSDCDGITDPEEYEDCVENFINTTLPQDPEDITDPEDLISLMPNGNLNLAVFIARPYVDLSNNIYRYIGFGEEIYCAKDGWKTGDLNFGGSFNDDLEELPALPADSFTGMYGINKYSNSLSRSVSAGWGYFSTGRSWTIYSRTIKDFMDINGDGYPDILQGNSYNLTNPTGGHLPNSNTNFHGNVDSVDSHTIGLTVSGGFPIAGRRTETTRVVKNSDGTTSETHNVDKNSGESIGIAAGLNILSENKSNEFLIDLNGDGIPDKVYKDGSTLKYKYTTFSHGGEPFNGLTPPNSFPNPATISASIGMSFQNVYENLNNLNESVFSGSINLGLGGNKGNTQVTYRDINGDGLVDIIYSGQVYYNLGNRFSNTPQPLTATHASPILGGLTLGDDSQSTNLALTGNLSYFIGYPICCPFPFIGFVPMIHIKYGVTIGGEVSLNINESLKDFRDMNGDGFLDYVKDESDASNSYIVYYSAIGKTNKLSKVTNSLKGSFELDYAPFEKTKESPYAKWVLSKVKTHDGYDMEIAGVNDGADITEVDFNYNYPYYDRREREFYGFAELIIRERTFDTGNLYRKTTLSYHNTNYFLRGLLKSSTVTDAQQMISFTENTYQLRKLDLANQHILTNILPETFDVGGTEGRRSASVLLTKTKQIFYENGGQLTKEFEFDYDSKGRVVRYDYKGDPNDTSDDYYSIIDYHSNTQLINKNILNIPKSIRVFDNQGQLKRRRATTNINLNNGLVGTYQTFLDSNPIETNVEYYANGNLKRVIAPENANGHQKTLEYTYDSQNSKYVIATLDNLGYTSSYNYDPKFDKILLTTDIAGNNMSYTYDNFGRLTQILAPKEAENNLPYTIRFDYHPTFSSLPSISGLDENNFVPVARTQHYDRFNIGNAIETLTFVDGFGSPIAVKKDIQIGGQEFMSISGMTEVDYLGRTIKEYQPRYQAKDVALNYVCDSQSLGITDLNGTISTATPQFYREYTYDMRDRAILVSDFDPDITVETQFSIESGLFKTKTITAQNQNTQLISEMYQDVNGRTIKSKQIGDQTLETIFDYNAIGELLSYTDADNLQTSYSYDGIGRKLSVNHPDNGMTKYYYDNVNNVIRLQTQKLIDEDQYIIFNYDEANRLISQVFPNIGSVTNISNTEYAYGGPNNGNQTGRLVYQSDASGEQNFKYGNMGELIYNERVVNSPSSQFSNQTFVTEYTYDSWNRLAEIRYPDGETVRYGYDMGGNLRVVRGQQYYIKEINYDHFEQRTDLTHGNDVTTTYTYSPELRRLSNLKLDVSGGQLQDLDYSYDYIGNVMSVRNNANPVNDIGGRYSHDYKYDSFNRLSSAEGYFDGNQTPQNNYTALYNLDMEYNNTHGIATKKQKHSLDGNTHAANSYTNIYDYYAGTHQVERITNIVNNDLQEFKYDANGNMIFHQNVNGTQDFMWDEVNRLRVVFGNTSINHNVYDAAGERIIKAQGNVSNVYENGQLTHTNVSFDNFVMYPSAFFVVDLTEDTYSKHYYAGGQRIAARMEQNNALFRADNDTSEDPKLSAAKTNAIEEDFKRYFKDKNVNISFDTQSYREGDIRATSSSIEELYFYHPDHLGTATFLTDIVGNPYQFFLNLPFGESMAEQRSYTGGFDNRWLFTGKELDESTGLYYFGARFYNPSTSIWLSVDPLAEKYPGISPYTFCNNNPVFYVDLDGLEPTPFPKALLGSVDYYKWRYNDFIKQNPGKKAPDYYLNYGNKYIQRFTNETNNQLSKQGQVWLKEARKNLQVAIEDKLKADPTIELRNGGNDFKKFAFNSHVDAYWNDKGDAPLYTLNTVDLVAIVLTPNFKDLTSEDGMKQATEMMSKLSDYWLDNPIEGLKRGVELLVNRKKIKAMVTAKAIREDIDPDKANSILEKIIEKIPTIKTN